MIKLSVLDLLASLFWLTGAAMLLAGVADGEQGVALVSALPLAAAATATIIAWLHRLLSPIRQACELAGAVVRLNGHSRERSPL